MFSIYLITNTLNEKCYVGKTCKPLPQRFREHVKAASSTNPRERRRYLQNAIRKHGAASFSVEPLASVPTLASANNLEKLWILLLRSTDCFHGYNMSGGGDGFNDPDGSIAARIGATLTGRKIPEHVTRKGAATRTGKKLPPFTAQHRFNLRIAHKPKHGPEPSPEIKKAMWRERMSEAAIRRCSEGRVGAAQLAGLAKGRTPEMIAHARKTIEAIPKEQRREMLRRASNARWHPERNRA